MKTTYYGSASPERQLDPAEEREPAKEPRGAANVANHVHQSHRRGLHDSEGKLLRHKYIHL